MKQTSVYICLRLDSKLNEEKHSVEGLHTYYVVRGVSFAWRFLNIYLLFLNYYRFDLIK